MCFLFVTMHAFDRQTDRQLSIARCDLTKLDAHRKVRNTVVCVGNLLV